MQEGEPYRYGSPFSYPLMAGEADQAASRLPVRSTT